MRNQHTDRLAVMLTVVTAALLPATAVQAHPKVVRSDPSSNAALPVAPKQIRIEFNERLMARFSSFKLAAVGRDAVPVTSKAEGRILVGAISAPLRSGGYRVTWRAAGADGHPMQGTFDFRVR